MAKKEPQELILPSSVADRKAIMDAMKEISDSYTRTQSEKEFVKEAIASLNEKFNLPKRALAKLSKVIHKGNFDEEAGKFEEFSELYEVLTNSTSVSSEE